MSRLLLLFALFAFVVSVPQLRAEDTPADTEAAVKANPDDVQAINKYIGERLQGMLSLVEAKKYDEAEKSLADTADFLATLEPTEEKAKQLIERFGTIRPAYESRIKLARQTIAELKTAFEADPTDRTAYSNLLSKYTMEISSLARPEPEQAETLLKEARAYFTAVGEKEEHKDNEVLQKQLATANQNLARYESSIAAALKHKKLIGQDALSLASNVEAWTNGAPLTDSELDGKVVLLDFWAVWCGPCIATFPHLREWNEKYGDSGLVIVGVTSYYNYKWDAEKGTHARAAAGDPKVSPEDEQAMLVEFAKKHELAHRFALQDGRGLSEFYGVTGIPQAVVIDRKGKVRMIRVGSGQKNADELGGMIEELLKEKI